MESELSQLIKQLGPIPKELPTTESGIDLDHPWVQFIIGEMFDSKARVDGDGIVCPGGETGIEHLLPNNPSTFVQKLHTQGPDMGLTTIERWCPVHEREI